MSELPEMPEPEQHDKAARLLQAMSENEDRKSTYSRRFAALSYNKLNTINDGFNILITHRVVLAENDVLEPLQKILSSLLKAETDSIETHKLHAESDLTMIDKLREV